LDLAGRFAEFLSGFAPRTLAWSASAAALAIVLQAGVLATVMLKDHDRSAETQVAQQDTARWAGLGNLASSTNGQGPVVVLRFTPQATMTDVTKFLEAYNGVLVDGPKRGLYTARLAVSGTPATEVPKVMQKIQAEAKIVEFIAIKE
jgi:hypothetical protein